MRSAQLTGTSAAALLLLLALPPTEAKSAKPPTAAIEPEVALPAIAQECVPPPPGMVGWWPGDGNADDIADANDGRLEGGATFTAGQVGEAFLLDGIDDAVDLGNASNLHVSSGDFTVDAWVIFNALSHPPGANIGAPQGDMSIVDKMSSSGTNTDGWRLLKQNDNRFWFLLGGPQPAARIFSTTVAVPGVWFHVAVVKSSTSFAIYVNGVLEDMQSPVPLFLDTNSANLRIGSYVLEGAHLNGLVDEVEIYNRALTSDEIQTIFNSGSAGKCKVVDADDDGITDDVDFCADTVTPDVPSIRLGTNRFALGDGGLFITTPPKGKGPNRSYTIEDTAGCSCEQIIDALDLGNGHTKFGCSISAMDNWVSLMTQSQ